MRKVEVSEIFYSLEGEGPDSGCPTVYIRFARCNKKCPKWNNPNDDLADDGYAKLDFDPKDFAQLDHVPLIHKGCDSQYAVNPKFAHMWYSYSASELMEQVLDTVPQNRFTNTNTYQPIIMSLTGGEPTLYMKFIVEELLQTESMRWCRHLLFETNCSVPIKKEHMEALYKWAKMSGSKITWSNSPKLSDSGETWKSSIKPAIAKMQHHAADYHPGVKMNQYFKFVHDGSAQATEEVQRAMNEYYEAGVPRSVDVILMPAACTAEQQIEVQQRVADICMELGYRFSIRLQSVLWGNLVGT